MSEQAWHRDESGWKALVAYLRRPAFLLSGLCIVTFIVYSGTLFFQFVWDDKTQIVDNPMIRSLGNLPRAFSSDLWYQVGRFQLYYRPLFVVWSILNYAALGLRPWGWHLGAVLMHLAAVITVFWLARKLELEYWTAGLAALVFALHPIHIECVAWISAASDSMVTALVALSFIAYINVRDPNNKRLVGWWLLSLFLFACALLTKEAALSFPILVGLYQWVYPREKSSGAVRKICDAVLAVTPYAALTLGYLLLRNHVLHQLTGNAEVGRTFGDMFRSLPYVIVVYLRQLVLPTGLTGLYYTPYAIAENAANLVTAVLVLAIVAALVYFWAHKRDDKLALFAGLWILICLAPALYLRGFSDGDFVRDRYIYLGSIGFAILTAKLIRLLPDIKQWRAQTLQGAAVVVLCLAYVGMSIPQQAYWASDLLTYLRGNQLYPENPFAAVALATEYARLGAYDRAIPLVEEAHRTHPHHLYAAYSLAYIYVNAGRKEEGRAALIEAQDRMPEYVQGETGAASVAAMWGQLGDYDRAFALCSRVLAQDPDLYSALYNCGNIQLLAGHYSEAEQLLRRAVQVAPELVASRHFLGRALFLEGKYAEAQVYLSQAASMDPGVYDYRYWLGRSLEQAGNNVEAQREYLQALQLNGSSLEAKQRLAALEAK